MYGNQNFQKQFLKILFFKWNTFLATVYKKTSEIENSFQNSNKLYKNLTFYLLFTHFSDLA